MSGVQDPIAALDQPSLSVVAREYLLCGHLIDRAAMGYLIGPWGRDGMRDIAIDEWMGASPVYTDRMQRLLGFAGDDDGFVLPVTQEELAAMVGASRERVNKAISQFVRLGWLERSGNRYVIRDRRQLTLRSR